MAKLLILLLERPSRLTEAQLDKLADVFINIGTLIFGATVIPYFVDSLNEPKLDFFIVGLALSIVMWFLAITFVRRIHIWT